MHQIEEERLSYIAELTVTHHNVFTLTFADQRVCCNFPPVLKHVSDRVLDDRREILKTTFIPSLNRSFEWVGILGENSRMDLRFSNPDPFMEYEHLKDNSGIIDLKPHKYCVIIFRCSNCNRNFIIPRKMLIDEFEIEINGLKVSGLCKDCLNKEFMNVTKNMKSIKIALKDVKPVLGFQ